MHTSKPRRVTALLAVLALLLAALPATAAPPTTDRSVASAPGLVAPLVHRLTTWLAALWPGFGPQAAREELGSGADPNGTPQSS